MKTLIAITSLYLSMLLFAEKSPKRQPNVFHSHIQCDTIYEFDEIQLGMINKVRIRLNLPIINNQQLDSLSQ